MMQTAKKQLYIGVVLLLITILSACSSPVKYLGNSYPSTTDVKIYFNAGDVGKPYEVIGKIYMAIDEDTKDSKIQKLIIDKAKKHGGDAVIMGDMQRVRSGYVSGGTGASTRAGKNSSVSAGGRKTKETNDLTMEIDVLKFKG
jgi:hypothetical protein